MRPVKIFTDSTADLSIELRKQYNISLIPLYVTIGDKPIGIKSILIHQSYMNW